MSSVPGCPTPVRCPERPRASCCSHCTGGKQTAHGVRRLQRYGLLIGLCSAASAPAAEINPLDYNCADFIRADERFQDWRQTVELETCDRVQRLARIAARSARGDVPRFFVETISAEKIPEIGVDIPLVRVVFPQRVFFDTADSELRPEGRQVVDFVAETLRWDLPDVAVFIAGHTDPRGGWDYNYNLSIDRANAVASVLRNSGVATGTIWRVGFGPDMPLVPNLGEESWGYNRRVEFLFAAKVEAVAIWLADIQIDGLCQAKDEATSMACKRELQLRSDYTAVEVLSTELAAQPESRQAISVPGAGKSDVHPTRGVSTIAPNAKEPVAVVPSGLTVAPVPKARMIVINPISRTSRMAEG